MNRISTHDLERGTFTLEDEVEKISQQIDSAARKSFIEIAGLTFKYGLQEFHEQSYGTRIGKITAGTLYPFLLVVGVITAYASLVLLIDSNYKNSLTVDFANTFTNTGALNAYITDIPAITWMTYRYLLKNSHDKALSALIRQNYHSYLTTHELDPDLREALYKFQLKKGHDLYLDSDPQSHTGALHLSLQPTLQEIARDLQKGVSYQELGAAVKESFQKQSTPEKIKNITLGTFPVIAIQALSIFLIFQNMILLTSTPVTDLFYGNKNDQLNEAFYLTQLGGLFSSITAFGAATYFSYRLFIRKPLIANLQKKIEDCFTRSIPLEASEREALHLVKKLKLEELTHYL